MFILNLNIKNQTKKYYVLLPSKYICGRIPFCDCTDKNVEGKEQQWKGMEVPPVTSVSALPCCFCVSGALPGALPRPRGTEFSW